MPPRNLGEKKSLILDDGEGVDQQGYILTDGTNGGEVKKQTDHTGSALGVNYFSSMNADDTEVRTGVPIPVIHDGYAMVLADYGNNYDQGDPVYISDATNNNSGVGAIATNVANEGSGSDGTKIGNVVPGASKDLSGESEIDLIQVDLTSNLGDSA